MNQRTAVERFADEVIEELNRRKRESEAREELAFFYSVCDKMEAALLAMHSGRGDAASSIFTYQCMMFASPERLRAMRISSIYHQLMRVIAKSAGLEEPKSPLGCTENPVYPRAVAPEPNRSQEAPSRPTLLQSQPLHQTGGQS